MQANRPRLEGATAHDLQAGRYAPVFEVNPRHDEVLWELSIDRF
jgi:uncharacterized protein